MKTELFDFTWNNPSPAQQDALTLAARCVSDLPPKEIAFTIFVAEQSEWMREIRWFYYNSPVDLLDDLRLPLVEMCELLILMIDRVAWMKNLGWWATSARDRYELLQLLNDNKIFMDFCPQYFSLVTRCGLDLVEHLLIAQRNSFNETYNLS